MIFVSKNISLLAVLFLCLGVSNCYSTVQIKSQKKKQRPNVVFILTDDQGSVDANCYGAFDLHTPNIDLLAKTGVKFSSPLIRNLKENREKEIRTHRELFQFEEIRARYIKVKVTIKPNVPSGIKRQGVMHFYSLMKLL
jgi:hypothetical protein